MQLTSASKKFHLWTKSLKFLSAEPVNLMITPHKNLPFSQFYLPLFGKKSS